mmetsp:Transcript_2362/g.3717  ORF Transcript_2362/g.3717 Transcript_2362/m.3717 type:complete len:392 (+) Transcript_2362:21-1196(+)
MLSQTANASLIDDDQVHCCSRIGRSWLICGKKKSRFPFQAFVGPDWPCMCVTYALIIGPSILFINNIAILWGVPVIAVTVFLVCTTLLLFSMTACTDPGIVFIDPPPTQPQLPVEGGSPEEDIPSNDPADVEKGGSGGTTTSTIPPQYSLVNGNSVHDAAAITTAGAGNIVRDNTNGSIVNVNQVVVKAAAPESEGQLTEVGVVGSGGDLEQTAVVHDTWDSCDTGAAVTAGRLNDYGSNGRTRSNSRGDYRDSSSSNPHRSYSKSNSDNHAMVIPPPSSSRRGTSTTGTSRNSSSNGLGYTSRPGPAATVECGRCHIQRPRNAYHCNECGFCVVALDHHCPWTGKCIGQKNLQTFYYFLASLWLLISFVIVMVIVAGIRGHNIFSFSNEE